MWSGKGIPGGEGSPGFTLVEVLIALVIVGLVATASIKLVIMSGRSLEEVSLQRDIIEKGRRLQFEAIRGSLPDSGSESELSWEIKKISIPILEGQWTVNYRTLLVRSSGREILFYIP
ncbi:MAG TPA: prepilin-type N-terminal cleavage/methylation domain-containing protein [Synergistales bacterium]|nr:prepilin-type N-terminal cleavage/methylation domain-containing protein [Synergistales bacterium]